MGTGQPGRPRKRPQLGITLPPGRAGFSPVEVADILGVSRTQIYQLLGDGELVSFHVGRKRRILADSIADYIDRQVAAEGQSA